MCRVISICNQKGGCSKSTVAENLGIGMARLGKKVLLMDVDPQGSLTASLGYQEPDEIPVTLATIMTNIINEEDFPADEGILHHEEGVDLLPANIELSGLEVSLANTMSREMVLREYVELVRDRYDYIILDCMPSLGVIGRRRFGSDSGAGGVPSGERSSAADQNHHGREETPEQRSEH